MGSMRAMEMAEASRSGQVSLRAALSYHLQVNHYPPHPSFMVPVAERAVAKANRGEWAKKVRLPEGVEHRRYGKLVPVAEVIESLHLDAFVVVEGEWTEVN